LTKKASRSRGKLALKKKSVAALGNDALSKVRGGTDSNYCAPTVACESDACDRDTSDCDYSYRICFTRNHNQPLRRRD
jgi:hypothetical protein